ncbi:MAG: hypothetical protein EBT07_12290 [Actinobacteria bacterium]|nr:hypothetical protein [Actinomycetota bacterium]
MAVDIGSIATQEIIEQQAIQTSQSMANSTQKITLNQILIAGLVGALISVGALYINSYVPKLLGNK